MTSEQILDRMRHLCSRREYSEGDILQKISSLISPGEDPEELLDILKNEKYVSDTRYAEAFARDKSALQGWGRVKIRHALAAKAVSAGLIDSALEKIDEQAAGEKLFKLLSVKVHSLQGDEQIKLKLIRFALGRGYQYDEIVTAIGQLDNL